MVTIVISPAIASDAVTGAATACLILLLVISELAELGTMPLLGRFRRRLAVYTLPLSLLFSFIFIAWLVDRVF